MYWLLRGHHMGWHHMVSRWGHIWWGHTVRVRDMHDARDTV